MAFSQANVPLGIEHGNRGPAGTVLLNSSFNLLQGVQFLQDGLTPLYMRCHYVVESVLRGNETKDDPHPIPHIVSVRASGIGRGEHTEREREMGDTHTFF